MLKQKYFLTGIFILSAERQPIKLAWRKIVWLPCNELVALNFLILGISLPIFRIAFFVLSIDSGNLWEIHRIALKIPDRNKIY